jgi:hypothetical protein
MGQSIRRDAASPEVNSLDSIPLKQAKATLRVNPSQSPLRALIGESIRAVSSQKAAALDMAIDPGQLTRQLQSGHLTIERLEALGPQFCARLGERLVQEFGPLTDPKDAARKSLESIEDSVRLIRQFVEQA